MENYGDKCWGLTASDDPYGYTAHRPVENDNGTISPTAALASMPYADAEALATLKYFYRERGNDLWGITVHGMPSTTSWDGSEMPGWALTRAPSWS